MKKLLIAVAMTGALTAPAAAADILRQNPPLLADPVAARIFDWSGFYLGGNLGYGWSQLGGIKPQGIVGGPHIGYNYQFLGGFMVGAEADLSLSGIDRTLGALRAKVDNFGSVRARIGYAVDRMLFYATGGWAWGRGTIAVGGVADRHTHNGWVLGLGAEAAITQNITARVEYLRLNLGAETYATIVGPIRSDLDTSILRLGLSYKF